MSDTTVTIQNPGVAVTIGPQTQTPVILSDETVVGLAAGQGSAGLLGDKYLAWSPATSSTLWTIPHNLAKNPAVVVIDSSGNNVVGMVTYIDPSHLSIGFNQPVMGTAFLN